MNHEDILYKLKELNLDSINFEIYDEYILYIIKHIGYIFFLEKDIIEDDYQYVLSIFYNKKQLPSFCGKDFEWILSKLKQEIKTSN